MPVDGRIVLLENLENEKACILRISRGWRCAGVVLGATWGRLF